MKVYLDDEPMELDTPSLRDAFSSAVELAGTRGRVIVDVLIDGTPVPGDLIADPPDEPMAGDELRFTSAEPQAMVRETLMDAVDALDQVCGQQRSAGDLVMAGRVEAVPEALEQILGIWQAVVLAVQRSTELLGLDLDSLEFGGLPVRDQIKAMGGHLSEMIRAVDQRDWSALGDALSFDLCEQAERWQGMLGELARQVYPTDGSGAG